MSDSSVDGPQPRGAGAGQTAEEGRVNKGCRGEVKELGGGALGVCWADRHGGQQPKGARGEPGGCELFRGGAGHRARARLCVRRRVRSEGAVGGAASRTWG